MPCAMVQHDDAGIDQPIAVGGIELSPELLKDTKRVGIPCGHGAVDSTALAPDDSLSGLHA
jgi:hypothetical protein